jgi:hypothetical protein
MTNVIRQTGCTFSRRLRRQATVVTQWSEALRTMYPTRRSREADGISESNTRYGTSLGCMVNGSELSINLVKTNKPKLLIGLSQKASGMDVMLVSHYTRSVNPPRDRQTLNTLCHHCGTWEPLLVRPRVSGKVTVRKPYGRREYRMVQEAKAHR